MKNPYDILGVSSYSTYEELENRYKELRKQYSEQRFKDGEEGNEGARKLNDLEVAWAQIKSEKEPKKDDFTGKADFETAEKLIKDGKYEEAQNVLDGIATKDAKWHYFQSVIYYRRDWLSECRAQLVLAVQLDPANKKYQDSLKKLDAVMNVSNGNATGGNSENNEQEYTRYNQQNIPPESDGRFDRNATDSCSDCLCTYLLCESCCTCSRCMIH